MINNDAIEFAAYVRPISFKFDQFDLQLIVEVLKKNVHVLPWGGQNYLSECHHLYQEQLAHRAKMYVIFHLARRLSEALLHGRNNYTIRLTPTDIETLQPLLEYEFDNTAAQVIFMKIHQKTIFK